MIDPQIPLQTQVPNINPTQTLGTLMNLKSHQLQQKRVELDNQQTELENEAKIKTASDDEAIRQAMQLYPGDLPKVVDRLNRYGSPAAASKIQSQFIAHQKEQHADEKDKLESVLAHNQLLLGMYGAVNDKASYRAVRGMMQAQAQAMTPEFKARVDAEMPEEFDPVRFETQRKALMTQAQQLAEQKQSMDEWEKGYFNGRRNDGSFSPEAQVKITSSIGRLLALTQNDAQWQSQLQAFEKQGVPKEILDKFDKTWSPEAVKRAAAATIPPKEAADISDREAAAKALAEERKALGRDRDRRAKIAADREARLANQSGAESKDPYWTRDRAEWEDARRDFERSQKALEDTAYLRIKPGETLPDKEVESLTKPFESFADWRPKNKGRSIEGKATGGGKGRRNLRMDTEEITSTEPATSPAAPAQTGGTAPVTPPPAATLGDAVNGGTPPAAGGTLGDAVSGRVPPPAAPAAAPPIVPRETPPPVTAQGAPAAPVAPVGPVRPVAPPPARDAAVNAQVGKVVTLKNGKKMRITAIDPKTGKVEGTPVR